MNFADELRAAARELRALAESATPGQWERDSGWSIIAPPPEGWSGPYVVVETKQRNDAEFIATMNPTVALALSHWLDHTASLIEGNKGAIEGVQSSGMALLTARAINGGGQ